MSSTASIPLRMPALPIARLNRNYHEAAGESSSLWEIPESTHVGGMTARPEEYERRVVGFFDRALR